MKIFPNKEPDPILPTVSLKEHLQLKKEHQELTKVFSEYREVVGVMLKGLKKGPEEPTDEEAIKMINHQAEIARKNLKGQKNGE